MNVLIAALVVMVGAAPVQSMDAGHVQSYVIGPDMQPVIQQLLDLTSTPASKTWKFQSAKIELDHVSVVYKQKSGTTAKVELHHPSQATGDVIAMGPFAVTSGSGPIDTNLRQGLASRIDRSGSSFRWHQVVAKTGNSPVAAKPAAAGNTVAQKKASARDLYVIGPDMQAVVQNMLDLSGSKVASSWKMASAQISRDHIKVTYRGPKGAKGSFQLHHPKQAKGKFTTVGPFAWVDGSDVLDAKVRAVIEGKIKAAASRFKWMKVTRKRGSQLGPDIMIIPGQKAPKVLSAVMEGRGILPFRLTEADQKAGKEVEKFFQGIWNGEVLDWESQLKDLLAEENIHPVLLFRIGTQVRDLKDSKSAQPIFESVIRRIAEFEKIEGKPLPEWMKRIRGGAFLALGQTERGLKDLAEFLAFEETVEEWEPCELAHTLKLGEGTGVKKKFWAWVERYREKHPNCPSLVTVLVDDLKARGDQEGAVSFLESTVDVPNPDHIQLDRLAELYVHMGKSRKAVARYRQLCELEDGKYCTARIRGNVVWAQSSYHREPDAIVEYMADADANPDNALRQFEVGVMLHYARRYEESLPYLTRARKTWSDDARILLYTAMNHYRSGHFKKAEEAIEYAVGHASANDPDLFYCLAVIYRNSNLPKAIENLTRYKKLAARGHVPPQKRVMVDRFLTAMHDEQKRREAGKKPRVFADPEAHVFGEPPGSPGHADDAIRFTKPVVAPVPTGPGPTVSEQSNEKPKIPGRRVGSGPMLIGLLVLLVLGGIGYQIVRKGRRS